MTRKSPGGGFPKKKNARIIALLEDPFKEPLHCSLSSLEVVIYIERNIKAIKKDGRNDLRVHNCDRGVK